MRKAVWLMGVALVVSVATCAWLWSQLRKERERHLAAIASVARSVPAPISPAEPSGTQQRIAASSLTPPPHSSAAAADQSYSDEDWLAQQRRLLKDPRYFAAQLDIKRKELAEWRADAVRLLGFSGSEADTLITAHAERRLNQMRREPELVDATPEGLRRAREAADTDEREYQDRLRELVGEEKRSRWETYLATRFARRQVEFLRSDLERVDGLRAEQIEPLIAALYRESSEYQRQLEDLASSMSGERDSPELQQRFFERQTELLTELNRRKRTSAARILSSAQLKRFDEILAADLERQRESQQLALLTSEIEASQPKAD